MSQNKSTLALTILVLLATSTTSQSQGMPPLRKSIFSDVKSFSGVSRSCLTGAAQKLLNDLEMIFGAVKIISTCRPGAFIAGTTRHSLHASGNAIDFDPGPHKGRVLQWLLRNHFSGGIMTYADMPHIHVDIGQRFISLNHRRTMPDPIVTGSIGRRWRLLQPRARNWRRLRIPGKVTADSGTR